MGAVGQLDQDNPNILHHGHHHLAEVFGLRLFAIAEFELVEFGDTGDQFSDSTAIELGQLFLGHRGVFDHIMQQGRHQGFVV